MTILHTAIADLPTLLAAEYPSIKTWDYATRDLNRTPAKLRKPSILEAWVTASSGTGTVEWTALYAPNDDGGAHGQWASGMIVVAGVGEYGGGTSPLLPMDGTAGNADLTALKAAQDAAAIYEPFWIRLEYTAITLTEVRVHFALNPILRIRKTARRDVYGHMSASRVGGRHPVERVGGHRP